MDLEKPISKQEKTTAEQEPKQEKNEVAEKKGEISVETVETADLLEKYFKQQFEAVNQRADKIISIGKQELEQGLKNMGIEIDENDPDYQEVQFFSKKLQERAEETKQEMKKVMEGEPRDEKREPFGDFELVISAPEKLEPDKELKIHLEDKEGNVVFDFKELLPEGFKIKLANKSRCTEDEVQIAKEEENFAKCIPILLHEVGHAWQYNEISSLLDLVDIGLARRGRDLESYKMIVGQEKDAWMRGFQMISAVRQTKGINLVSPFQNQGWEEVKKNMMRKLGSYEKKYFKEFGDQEIKNLFQETLGANESDLEKFDSQLELSEKTAQKNVRRVLSELYDKFNERKKQNPASKFSAGHLEVAQTEDGTPLTSAFTNLKQMFEVAHSFNELPREEIENFINNLELNDAGIKEKIKQKMYQQKISGAIKKVLTQK